MLVSAIQEVRSPRVLQVPEQVVLACPQSRPSLKRKAVEEGKRALHRTQSFPQLAKTRQSARSRHSPGRDSDTLSHRLKIEENQAAQQSKSLEPLECRCSLCEYVLGEVSGFDPARCHMWGITLAGYPSFDQNRIPLDWKLR